MIKLSLLPRGTVISVVSDGRYEGRYERKGDWHIVDNKDGVALSVTPNDMDIQSESDDTHVQIVSVPWGVVEELIDTVHYAQDPLDDPFSDYDKQLDDIFEEAIEGYQRRLATEYLEAEARRQADMRARVAEIHAKRNGTT